MNPDKDKCGMIWMCPTVPFDGANVKKAIDMIEAIIIKYGFEPAISMQCTSERSVHLIASIAWDRQVAGEDEKAEQCYDELHIALHEQGYYFYRETTHAMASQIVDQDNTLDDFLKGLKRAVDPNNVLAPGRYIKG
jgi:4-cresol dehydrogenase (hydroxylating)